MKTFLIAVFAVIFMHFEAISQTNQYSNSDDTLTFHHRTGGSIDTFDLTYSFPMSTLPGGTISKFSGIPTIDFYRNSPSLFLHTLPEINKKWTLSALPHLGFFYSFGTKGTQFLHADYQQSFQNKSLLNFEIDRSSSAGMPRNGDFADQGFKTAYRFGTRRITGEISGFYNQDKTSLNGGISNDSSWIDQGIGFAPVRKGNANSTQRFVRLNSEFKYNLLKDSSIVRLGVLTRHNYSNWNREYNEASDTLNSIYGFTLIDSLTTRDQFQDAKIKNSVGLFIENRKFKASISGSHRYWRFQNLGTNRDTNEVSAELNLGIRFNKFKVNSENYLNIIGAKNEFSSKSSAKWGSSSKYLAFSASIESLLPSPVQRFYFGNNLSYLNPLIKQERADINFSGAYSFWKIDGTLTAGSLTWKNNLQWQNTNWGLGNESNLTITYIKTKLHFDFNWLHLYPELQLNNRSDNLPSAILSGRLLVKKKVFAAKKLELLFALDPQLSDKYTFMSYNTLLDNWYFDPNNRSGGQRFTLHSTITFHIEEFRFFIRAENLQAFWTPSNIEIAQDYYRPSFLLRLGLSWDFFN